MKVLSVVGNRPQFIKSGPLSVALRGRGIGEVVVHTGQHYDRELSDVFFEELELPPPAYSLDLQTADVERLTPAIAAAVDAERPDWVLVYGDTNSTLAGARAAGRSPVAHVEAGLRSGDLTMPEEHNRIEVDRISSLLFTPDERSKDVLEAEGVQGRIDVVGDVMADANMRLAPLARERSRILEESVSRGATTPSPRCTGRRTSNPTALRGSSKACPGWASGSSSQRTREREPRSLVTDCYLERMSRWSIHWGTWTSRRWPRRPE